jgi:hypothetical protein
MAKFCFFTPCTYADRYAGNWNQPVCLPCHERLHYKDAWVKDRQNSVLGNHQQSAWVRKLQRGYRRLSGQGLSIGWLVFLGVTAIVGYATLGQMGAGIGMIAVLLLNR